MDSATIASELVRQIGRKLDADAQLWTGFGIYIETDDFGTVSKAAQGAGNGIWTLIAQA